MLQIKVYGVLRVRIEVLTSKWIRITKGKAFATLRLARIRGSAGNLKAARAISNLERLTPRLVCRFAYSLDSTLAPFYRI
jgi:hypothetical protein